MKTDQMQTRARHQCGQAPHEFRRQHPDVRGAITPGALELQHNINHAIVVEPLVGNRRALDVATPPFEFLALMRATAHRGVRAKAVRIGAQDCCGFLVRAEYAWRPVTLNR